MDFSRTILLTVVASAAAGFALGGGIAPRPAAPAAEAPAPEAPPATPDPTLLIAELDPLFAPIWSRGRITGFVAAELTLEFPAAAANAADRVPELRDRLLSALYRAGAEGRLDPGHTDPDALRAGLLAAARGTDAPDITAVRIEKLIHQENRRGPGGP